MKNMQDQNYAPGCSIDVGTMNLVSARQTPSGKVVTKSVRDCFLDLEADAKKTLKLSKVPYTEQDGQLVVLGESAFRFASLFKREVRRPLQRGVIAAGELDAQKILSLLIFHVLDEPLTPNEPCFYSVPASPVDDPGQDVHYHQEVFRKILSDHGYKPTPVNEAMAIIFSQCAAENFSGVAISMGSGMANVALSYQTVQGLAFSHTHAGDWVDAHSAKAVGLTAQRMCSIKEKGVDLLAPKNREEEALALYMRSAMDYTLHHLKREFDKARTTLDLAEPIPVILSGGMSKAGNFLPIFQEALKSIKLPFEVSEVRLATDPMTAVAEGLLVLSQQDLPSYCS